MTASTVLVLGARGRFGAAAVEAFRQAGWQVVAQARAGRTGPAQAGVRWVAADPDDTEALAQAAQGAQVVVHALSPRYTHRAWRRELPGLTQAAIAIARRLEATLMLPASVYNFGECMPPELREDTAQAAITFKGRMRIESERAIEAATRDGRMRAVVIRGGDFFGSGQGSWLDLAIAKALRAGQVTYPGALDVPTAWAYLPDMARAFVRVAQRRDRLAPFEILHFGGYTLTGAQWVDVLRDLAWEHGWLQADGSLRVRRVPWPLMRAIGLFVPTVAALCEMSYLWTTPHRLVNRRMAELIGPEPHTPFDQAVRESLKSLGFLRPEPGGAAPQLSSRSA